MISCGHAPVKTPKLRNFEAFKSGEYWGYRDKITNETVIFPVFDLAAEFQEGLAPVLLNGKWGYLDETGRIAIRPQYAAAYNFSDGQALVTVLTAPAAGYSPLPQVMAQRWIDKQGKTLFQASGVNNEGMEIIVTPDRKYGYASNLKVVVRPELEDAKNCQNNLCLVKNNGKYAFIDYGGAVKMTTEYDDASEARCGFYRVKSGGKYGFIDPAGAVAAPVIYDVLEEDACRQDIKAVLDGKFGVVRRFENWSFVEDGAPKADPFRELLAAATAQLTGPVPEPAAEQEKLPAEELVRENKAGHLVAFELSSRQRLLPVQTPLPVNVRLKRRFNGIFRIYSTDMNKLVLLDVKKGEYLKSMDLEVNGVPGKVFTIYIGLLPAGGFAGLLLGAEVAETASMRDRRYHARMIGEETMNVPPGGDWFPEEGVENLLLTPQNRFGAARAKKILACDQAASAKALPQLVQWFAMDGAQRKAAEEGLKTIIQAYGGGDVVGRLNALLRDNDLRTRKKWFEGLRLCGPDAKMAAEEIKMFFGDEDKELRDSAFALYGELGLDIPPQYAAEAGAAPEKEAEYKKNIDGVYKYAVSVSTADPLRAIEAVEKALKNNPPYEESAKLYLLLGRLKKQVESDAAYGKAHPGEYSHDESGDRYFYNGKHFMHLLMKFPETAPAHEAAYELTELSAGGECGGVADCHIERQFNRVNQFLKDHPGSKFAENAVARANKAFTSSLKDIGDYNAARERYNPERIKALLQEYDDLAALFPHNTRIKAYLTIAGLWAKFLNYERARRIYKAILADAPDEGTAKAAKEGLAALPAVDFILSPVKVSSSSAADLEWARPALDEVTEYAVHRSSAGAGGLEEPVNFAPLARLQGTQFSDLTAQPGAAYWYYVEAVTPKGGFPSNKTYCQLPAPPVPPQ